MHLILPIWDQLRVDRESLSMATYFALSIFLKNFLFSVQNFQLFFNSLNFEAKWLVIILIPILESTISEQGSRKSTNFSVMSILSYLLFHQIDKLPLKLDQNDLFKMVFWLFINRKSVSLTSLSPL